MILNGMLPGFISHMMGEVDEEMLWQLYLAKAPFLNESFAEWKEKAVQGQQDGDSVQNPDAGQEADVEATVRKAESILAGIVPA